MTRQHDQIDRLLAQLSSAIRRYVFLEAVAVVLAIACAAFWLTLGFDWIHFQISKLELPLPFRVACTVAAAGLLVATGVVVLGRLFRGLQSRSLALVLERRFPELNDRLITAVELGSRRRSQSPDDALQAAMISRTAREAEELSQTLEIDSVFDNAPLRRMVTVAAVLVASVVAFGVVNAQAMERWVHAYLLGTEDYWSPYRRNKLLVRVISQPGDHVREFAADGTFKHARGANLELQVLSADGHLPPEEVQLQTVSFSGGRTQRRDVQMQRIGESEFRHRFDTVISDMQLRVTGGDFTNRTPLRVLVVDPPRVDRLALKCDYPSYTGWDSLEDRLVTVSATQASVPMETRFELVGQVNKPIRRVHLRTPRFDVSFEAGAGQQPLRMTVRDRGTQSPRTVLLSPPAASVIRTDRMGFQVPLWISATADEKLDALGESGSFPIPLPSGSAVQIYLEDEDQIYSPDPSTFVLSGIPDQPPVVDAGLRGVRNKVTRMAIVPIEGRVTDDYGVARGWFSFQTGQQKEPQQRPLHVPPAGEKEFRLRASQTDPLERFQLLPLELKEGETISLSVQAADGDVLNGPHISRGQPFQFTIVSVDELLAALYDDEINLRLRFEHIYEEIKKLREDFLAYQSRAQEGAGSSVSDASSQSGPLGAFAERSLHQLRKNHTESRAIEVSFKDLREEMVNNQIDTRELIERIENGVLQPLHALNEQEFTVADERIGLFRLMTQRNAATAEPIAQSIAALDVLIARMEAILAEMRDRSSYNQLIQQLQQLIEQQEKLMEETQEKGLEEKFFQLQ